MSIYAKNTSVSVEKSRGEIEAILSRYGASSFAYATGDGKAFIKFSADGRQILFVLELPDRKDRAFTHTRGGKGNQEWTDAVAYQKWEQACRQRWRALALSIKSKLESVQSGISTFEEEFMSRIILPGGKTVGQHLKPAIETAYQSGKIPPMMLEFK